MSGRDLDVVQYSSGKRDSASEHLMGTLDLLSQTT